MINTDVDADELSSSRYATRRKELLSLVQQLRAMGAQGDLDLPRITVIGNQSAGKSSVVEAISGITVPRDAGTCTRCPMECRLSSSEKDWSCQISIRWEFEDDGSRKDETSEEKFGDLITNKADVEPALRRAQDTVLKPRGGGNPLPFSQNVVCVDLQGPDLTDLSFIDLPGIIQNADDDVVKLVENLVVSHIKGNCLILVALPMTDDIENQKALRLARREDPDGRRTIGVLTKPDILGAGSTKAREMWLGVIEGRRHPLAHGYYCTRQPDDSERAGGISSHDARTAESNHFSTTSPWSTSLHRNRFGTNNLISTLSKLLVQVIKDALPGLRAETTTCLDNCKNELRQLPQPIQTEPVTCLLSLITSFHSAVDGYVQGGRVAQDLVHHNREAFTKFRDAIKWTAPNFQPYVDAQAAVAISNSSESDDDDDSEDEDSNTDSKDLSTSFYLTDMRMHIEKSITRELPGHVPYESNVALIAAFQETWDSSTNACFDQVKECMLKTLLGCIERTFRQYANLQALVTEALYELVEMHYRRCSEHVSAILEVELTPYTQNTHYLESCKDKWLARYKGTRAGRSEEHASETSNSALSYLASIGYPGLSAEDLGKLNPPDEYETELRVMAEVRGYFQVSYKRVIDNVPSLIDLKFTKAIPKDIQSFLIDKLGLGATDAAKRCANYLAEDPTMVARRDELMARKKRLENVRLEIQNFGI